MKDHHKDKAHREHKLMKQHPLQKGAGMPHFEKDHWQKSLEDIEVDDKRYSSEMNQESELRKSVDELAQYAKKHKMKH